MPRGQRKIIEYKGKAAKLNEKVLKLEADLQVVKAERDTEYKEQLKAEKLAVAKQKKEEAAAAKKALREKRSELLKAIEVSGKSPEEIIAMLSQSENKNQK